MNKRQKKKQLRKRPGYKEAERLAEEIIRDFGTALGEARAEWVESLMKSEEKQMIVYEKQE